MKYYPGFRVALYDGKGKAIFDQSIEGNTLRNNKTGATGAKAMMATLDKYFANKPAEPEPAPTPTTYTVTFHRNYDSSDTTTRSQTFQVGVEQGLLWKDSQLGWANPSGKTFLGWAETATATKGTWANGEKVLNLTTQGGTKNLYAVWKSTAPAPQETYVTRLNESLTTKQINQVLDSIDKNDGYCPCQPKGDGTKCHCDDYTKNKKIGEPCICKIYVKQKK